MIAKKTEKALKQVKTVKTKNTTTLPVLGYTCWWTIHKNEIDADAFKSIVETSLGRAFLPDSPSMRKALKNTLEAIESKGIITRIPSIDKTQIAYTLHKKEVDSVAIDLELLKEQTIVYDKVKNQLEVRSEYRRQEIMDLVAKYSNVFTDDDIRMIASRYIASIGAITMRETGGIYFILSIEHRDKLRSFLQACNSTLYDFTVFDTEFDRITAHELVKDELQSELVKITEEVKQFLGKENKRIDTLDSRLDRFKELREKAKLYSGLLANDIEELQKQIDVVTDEVRSALDGKIEEYPQAIAFPLHSNVLYTGKTEKYTGQNGTVIGFSNFISRDKPYQYIRVQFSDNFVLSAGSTSLKLA